MKRLLILTILGATLTVARGQDSIVYVDGPSFQIPSSYWSRSLDVNSDGVADFTFWETGMLCTQDIPTSACGWPFHVGAVALNQMLMIGRDVQPQRFGDWVGDSPPAGCVWDSPSPVYYGAGLAYWWYSRQGRVIDGQLSQSGWRGGVGEVGVGYIGVRFLAPDGLHYGWIRVRLPQQGLFLADAGHEAASFESVPLELVPVVVDWAYETRPDTPIRAGAITSNEEAVQLTAEFGNSGATGTFILSGNTLRAELTLTGRFDSAEIHGPAEAHSEAKPLWSFGPPLVSRDGYTAFFGDATLSRGQVMQLLRGALYVSIDGGTMLGFIVVPDAEDCGKRRR